MWVSAWTDIRTRTIFEPLVVFATLLAISTHFSWQRVVMTVLFFGGSYLIVKIGKLGLGDAELLALLVSSFGGFTTLVAIVIGTIIALVFALIRMVIQKKRRNTIPLAPFLAVGISVSFLIAASFSVIWSNADSLCVPSSGLQSESANRFEKVMSRWTCTSFVCLHSPIERCEEFGKTLETLCMSKSMQFLRFF